MVPKMIKMWFHPFLPHSFLVYAFHINWGSDKILLQFWHNWYLPNHQPLQPRVANCCAGKYLYMVKMVKGDTM
jgi:hypothetical protein